MVHALKDVTQKLETGFNELRGRLQRWYKDNIPDAVPRPAGSASDFVRRMGQVKIGWTVLPLLRHAGWPKDPEEKGWFYLWEEPNGGLFVSYTFQVQKERVTRVEKNTGHRHVQ